MKRIALAALLITGFLAVNAQVKSPKDFLGYELGTKWTPHFKLVNYFNHVAAAAPQQVKLMQYGETYEGRPLYLAFVSTSDNINKLEEIRLNNLRLTGMLTDKAPDANAPAIVWLSYNVHGNETSSSEVSMKVLYELLNPAEFSNAKEWLKNTVVIIDPCINPDGRDRYINWYNSVAGKMANPNPDSREHNEPWPGGRTNHYNFDLNRDWAWQTQTETQSRIKVYNQWMPQIHSDYHEQGFNAPYYFAPAAEPFHEVITSWQRDLQTQIGKNNASYFDKNGWLYFTKEIFDLLYPSYGDTYPTYNGSVGMTFEQGGHSRGGLAVTKRDGEVLTLADRIAHHFTTSMSTLEIASKNNSKIIKEFQNFFTDSKKNAVYKTYFLQSDDKARIDAVKTLLDKNGIKYSNAVSTPSFSGYNYATGKTEAVSLKGEYAIALSSNQPKAALLKVLMEPVTKLSDSVTYDITAWALPYVYGINGYASKEALQLNNTPTSNDEVRPYINPNVYAYAAHASAANGKFIAKLLQKNIKVRFSETSFTSNGNFAPGSLIVLMSENKGHQNTILATANACGIDLAEVSSGMVLKGFDFGSDKVHLIKKPNIGLVTGKDADANAAGEVWHLFEQQLDYPINLYNAEDIDADVLKKTDVLIFPNGSYKMLSDKEASADLKTWVRQGGKIIALENAVSQLVSGDWGLKSKKAEEEKKDGGSYADIKKYESRERDGVASFIPGAIYKTELDNTHPLAFGYPNYYHTLKMNSDVYEFMKDGWNVGVIKKDKQVAGFVGSKLQPKIQDGTVIGAMEMGRGQVIFFADNPIFRCFWENGKLLLENAVFVVGN